VAKPKSILLRIEVDRAQRAHNCQHNGRHRLQRGDLRLKVIQNRSPEHFCVPCGLKFVRLGIDRLQELERRLAPANPGVASAT
jgi:hypothetical protein